MKKIIYLFFVALGLYSCDLDTDPTDAVTEEQAFDNVRNASYAYNGAWAALMETYYSYQSPGYASFQMASDAMGSDVAIQPGKYGYLAHYQYTAMSSTTSSPTIGLWRLAYRVANNANIIISKIDDTPARNQEEETLRTSIKGQAYALRGFMYWNLVSFYGYAYQYKPDSKCVPIYTEPTTKETEGKPKSTVAEVYKQAEEDLLVAYNLLKDYKQGGKHEFNQAIVAGLLARVYSQRMNGESDWKNAQKYAGEAQKAAEWMAKVEYLTGFNDRANKEWLWGQGQTAEQSNASYSFNYKDVKSQQSYYYSFFADPSFMKFFEDKDGKLDEGDIRTQLFEWDLVRYKGALMYKKFIFKADKTADIVLMRKAEMILIEAEAMAELSDLPGAVSKLNELKSARGAKTLKESDIVTKEDFIKAVMIERRKELFGEGFSLIDIKRRQNKVERVRVVNEVLVPGTDISVKGHTVVVAGGKVFEVNSNLYNFVIPAEEVTNNPNLDK